jgi:hypothetical protein
LFSLILYSIIDQYNYWFIPACDLLMCGILYMVRVHGVISSFFICLRRYSDCLCVKGIKWMTRCYCLYKCVILHHMNVSIVGCLGPVWNAALSSVYIIMGGMWCIYHILWYSIIQMFIAIITSLCYKCMHDAMMGIIDHVMSLWQSQYNNSFITGYMYTGYNVYVLGLFSLCNSFVSLANDEISHWA